MLLTLTIFFLTTLFQLNYETMRQQMVEEQIKRRGITNIAVLNAMRNVPRHIFVPKEQQTRAYNDCPLDIGMGQTISQPYIVAYMTQKLNLKSTDRVLEVGTGSGYQAAILAYITDSVYTIEIIPELAIMAKNNLDKAAVTNVRAKCGDGYNGWKKYAPFDAIIVTAAPEQVPQALFDQLAPGGRLIVPVGKQHHTQHLILYKKIDEKISSKTLLPVRFVPFTRDGK